MNFLFLAKKNIVDPVNDYVIAPVITNPINNYVVNPIQNLVRKKEEQEDEDEDEDIFVKEHEFEPYPPYPPSTLSTPLLENKEECTYFDNVKEKLYYSGVSFKASFYFFVNAWFPNYLKDEAYTILENLKKND